MQRCKGAKMTTEELNEIILDVLDKITSDNYDHLLGTYDYDGIAESVFATIERIKKL
jgi:hypothetical protein